MFHLYSSVVGVCSIFIPDGGPRIGLFSEKPFEQIYFLERSDDNGRYHEPIGDTVAGITCAGESVFTRHHKWKIEIKRESAEGALEFCQ